MEISTIGLDLAKNVFQVHGISATGEVVVRKALRRAQMLPFFEKLPPCLVGIEACGTSHHWARELTRLGHEVRLMPPAYVKPYVKRGKNDAADAEAICEAVTRQTMRFVPIKSRDQQAALSLHRVRNLLIGQRTQLVNMMRSMLAEFGIAIPLGLERALQMARQIVDGEAEIDLPSEATGVVAMLSEQAPISTDGFANSTFGLLPSSAATTWRGAWPRSPALALSEQPHLPHRLAIPTSSGLVDSSPPGSV
jgi:transposase